MSESTHPTVAADAVGQAGTALPQPLAISPGEPAGAANQGLLAFSAGVGLAVLHLLMEEDVAALAGVKGRHGPARGAVRHGYEDGPVTLGGRRVPVRRPRARTADGTGGLPVATDGQFTHTGLLGQLALGRMLAGLSARGWRVGLGPPGAAVTGRVRATSRPAASRRSAARAQTALAGLLAAGLSGTGPAAVLAGGVGFAGQLCVAALVTGADGRRHPVGCGRGRPRTPRWSGDLLAGLRERGLDVTRPVLAVLDGAKALVRGSGRCPASRSPNAVLSIGSGMYLATCPRGSGAGWRRCAGGPGGDPTLPRPGGTATRWLRGCSVGIRGRRPACGRGWPRRWR